MKKEVGQVTKTWLEARKAIEDKNLEQAEHLLDKGIALLAMHAENGVGDKDLIEGVKRETWLERFWICTEKHIWPTRPDFAETWED